MMDPATAGRRYPNPDWDVHATDVGDGMTTQAPLINRFGDDPTE